MAKPWLEKKGGGTTDIDRIKELYLNVRKKFLARCYLDFGRFGVDHIVGRTSTIAEEVLGSSLPEDKSAVRKKLRELPFGVKNYSYLSDCQIVEISFESGVHGSNILSPYLRKANRIYLASPFLNARDIEHIYDLAKGLVNERPIPDDFEFKVITNKSVNSSVAEVRVLDIHAKFLVTDSVAILGSMNFNSAGLKRAISHELLFITKDRRFIRDLTERFLWWWDLAGEIDQIKSMFGGG